MIRWLRNRTLKTKLTLLTVLLIVVVMTFVGSIVLDQQRKSLQLQMESTGRFFVKNLAKNVVGPLLEGDNLSLNNLIASLEARDKLEGNPARFTLEEYHTFLTQFFLEDYITLLKPFITKHGDNIRLHAEELSAESGPIREISAKLLDDVINISNELQSQEQYVAFFTQHPWTKFVVESLSALNDLEVTLKREDIPDAQRQELETKIAERLLTEILNYVTNPVIGYAIVLDKEDVIQAHSDVEFLGETYKASQSVELIEQGEEISIYRLPFKGESHFDFYAPVQVRDKNIGTAHIGSVHVGLREENLLQDVNTARQKIIYIAIIAIVLGSAGSYLLASLIVKPIKGLVKDAEILGGGNLDHQISVTTCDEVGTLAKTLDTTRGKLKDAQKRLVASERLARELEIAKDIQMALLPKETPSLERLELGTLYRSAAQVGGDLYDFFWVSEHELGIVVADVSGKGVPGSLVMTMAKAVIRAKAIKSDSPNHTLPAGTGLGGDPASVIRKTNQMIAQDIKKGMFITANYGILNVETLQFQFVSAGHNDTLVYNSYTRELREYNPKGIALGLDKGMTFDAMLKSEAVSLSSGDLLIQYTDGITEAMNEQHDEFGDDRLKESLRMHAHKDVHAFLAALDQDLRTFTNGFTQNDDITAVVIKVK
ncbi:hypothetical protein CSA56_08420 [candidate division KSB3 bacterium]|uniref:HAMP domain-containing protein n=1 Tax=candidate division KSB3 bacterium TaxID=2044937 RepID=A0A2G6KEN6_9BACT|nr:MAG: hypothetical protein CSA56_08420 [candidate division KSB3 bacterium]